MAHPIGKYDLPGIAEGRLRRLNAAGFHTLEDLVAAGPERIAAVPHVPLPIAQRAVEAASRILRQPVNDPTPKPDTSSTPDAPAPEREPEPAHAPEDPGNPPEDAPYSFTGLHLRARLRALLDRLFARLR